MYPNIIFDLCGPIINIDIAKIDEKLQACGVPYEQPYIMLYKAGITKEFEAGRLSVEEFTQQVCQVLHTPITITQLEDAWNSLITCFNPIHIHTIQKLKEQGINTFILSNSDIINATYFTQYLNEQAGFNFTERCFNEVVYSYNIGYRKPEPEIFRHILQVHHIQANDTLFIDDCQKHCLGAQALGFHTHYLQKDETLEMLF